MSPIDFHAEQNHSAYTTRQTDPSWNEAIQTIVDVGGKQVADIGCSGGIYTKASVYLQLLGQELQQQQITGEILVNDGILLLLDIQKPRGPQDIDAYLSGNEPLLKDMSAFFGGCGATLRQTARDIAEREQLAPDWLETTANQLLTAQQRWLEYPGLRIYEAPVDYMLAMKVAAPGAAQDIQDVKLLAEKLHLVSTQEVYTCITRYIPEQLLTPEMRAMIDNLFEGQQRE